MHRIGLKIRYPLIFVTDSGYFTVSSFWAITATVDLIKKSNPDTGKNSHKGAKTQTINDISEFL